jgi:hypothetical protein
MRARVLTTLIVFLAAPVLTGCGGGGDGSILHSGDSMVLVGAEADMDGPIAGVGFGGRVAMVGHCLGIESATIIWPYGTTIVSDDPLTIQVPGLGPVQPGDSVDGGGVGYSTRLPKGIDAIPSGCPTEDVFEFAPDG